MAAAPPAPATPPMIMYEKVNIVVDGKAEYAGNIQLSLMQGVEEGPAKRLRVAERAVRDAADVLKSLTAVCRTQPMPAMQPLDLNHVVAEVVELSASTWRDAPKARGAGEALSVALKVAMAWLKASWPRSVR